MGIKCKLCGRENVPAADSHIFPKGFFRKVTQRTEQLLLIGDGTVHRNKSGVHDKTIVCQECERRYFSVDDYAIKVLKRKESGIETAVGKLQLIVFPKIDRRQLRKFLASILWRGHVSKLPPVRSVNLGTYADRIRDELLNDGDFCFVDCLAEVLDGTFYGGLLGIHQRPFNDGTSEYVVLLPNLQFYVSLGAEQIQAAYRGRYYLMGHGPMEASSSLSAKVCDSAWLMVKREQNQEHMHMQGDVLESQARNPISKKLIKKYILQCEQAGLIGHNELGPIAKEFFK